MSKRKVSRRKFLSQAGTAAAAGLGSGPLLALLDIIAEGAIQRAFAETAGITPRKWLDLKFDAAPPRWTYDLFLKASDADNTNFLQGGNKQLATRYTEEGGVYTGTQYATSTVRGIRAPYVWRFNVPTASGGTRPMGDLLANLLHIRGINSGNPGHGGAQALHFAPLGAIKTVSALAADDSDAPIAAVNYTAGSYLFRSRVGKSHVNVGTSNVIANLMAPFRASTSIATLQSKETMVRSYMDAARVALTNSAVARDPDSAVAREAVQGARELMTRSFGNLTDVWNALQAKYLSLIDRAIHGVYAGINDKPIGISGTRDGTYRINNVAGADVIPTGDLRNLIAADTTNLTLANSFALAEFVLLNDLSDSVTARIGGLTGIKNGTATTNWVVDEHFVGCMASTMVGCLHGIAQTACLLELIDRLKAAGLWNETIINVSGEFNRSPRTTGIGADHGYQGASVCIYSGIISGPTILGNLAQDLTPGTYKGTWGAGAPVAELNNTQVDRGNVAASYAALLRVPSPITARTSLLSVSNNSVSLNVPTGKIIV